MLNIVLFGPPGSGKGTQSEKLIAHYGLKHLSTGDLLRKEMKENTPLGIEAKKLIEKGLLVPDEIVICMISNELDANPNVKGFLFDGFPRTIAQAEALDRLLELKKTSINSALALIVNEEELIQRLINRAKTSGRLDDADPVIQKSRQDVYKKDTLPVADYYKSYNKFKEINGEGSIDEIFERLKESINNLIAQD